MNIISIADDVSKETLDNNFQNLRIAELNLSDFNERMSKDYDLVCRFTNGHPRFFLKQELRYPDNTNTIASQINWLLMWKKEINDRAYFKIFFNEIQRDFEEIFCYHSPYVEKDDLYDKLVYNFRKRYLVYAPLGFLDIADENYIKEEINRKYLQQLP
ncbi:hypothetical protein [Chryseobacterium sp.]|uniref:hypothetical protein n=1 Tax=Chryseobacterium sp. TaxID=1871047 RepID=UPI002897C967|nr:hypothetical protein [Chryseobacterium sp.]